MINFKPMTAAEFSAFLNYLIPDYAEEISSSYRLPKADAFKQAQDQIDASLPEGVETSGQVLLSIFYQDAVQEHHVGYFWYKPDEASQSVFIYDFSIFPAWRNKGLGSAAMNTLEKALRQQGFTQIKLRVAAGNERARHVYETSGFRVNGFNMNKLI
uniref:GNAT family N-acetyltransferase n=1 Tax=Pantoea sp. IMH TaxID=1267600 RepID=UPI0004688A0C|nr:GNAT family N-acetyltransferase [Pantoea sp. IMH]